MGPAGYCRFTGATGSLTVRSGDGALSQYVRGKTGWTAGTNRELRSRPSTLIIGEGVTTGLWPC